MDRGQFDKLLAEVVPGLRNLPGVHRVEPVVFHSWRDDVGKTQAPWAVNGAMVFVQSKKLGKLKDRIAGVYKTAAKLDQEMMVLEPLGDLDSM